jgi:hypothetical protein
LYHHKRWPNEAVHAGCGHCEGGWHMSKNDAVRAGMEEIGIRTGHLGRAARLKIGQLYSRLKWPHRAWLRAAVNRHTVV